MSFHILDIIFAIIALIICVYSLIQGFIKRISGAIATVAGFLVSYFSYQQVYNYLKLTENLYKYVIFITIFIVCFIVIKLILKKFSNSISDTAFIGTLNRLLALLLGILESGVIICLISIISLLINKEFALQSLVVQFLNKLFV